MASRPDKRYVDSALLECGLDASSQPMEVAGIDGSMICVNDAWCRLFDLERGQVTGPSRVAQEPGDRAPRSLTEAWLRCLTIGRAEGEFLYRPHGGAETPICWTSRLCGEATGVITIFRPVASPDTTVGEAGATGAAPPTGPAPFEHDLRNLLAVIAGNVQLLTTELHPDTQRDRLALIEAAVAQGLTVLDGLSLRRYR